MNIEVNVLNATTIEIAWDQSGSEATTSTNYEITFEATDDDVYYPRNGSFLTSEQHFTVQNLYPFREYLLSVTRVDQAGVRSETVEVKAMTFPAGGLSCDTFASSFISLETAVRIVVMSPWACCLPHHLLLSPTISHNH